MELFKNKKIIAIGASIILLVVSLGIVGINSFSSSDTEDKVSVEDLVDIIDAEYSIDEIESSDTELTFNMNSDMTKEEVKEFIKSLDSKNNEWNKKVISANIYANNSEINNVENFYVEGLKYIIEIDKDSSVANISEFVEISKSEQVEVLDNFSNEEITVTDSNLVISMDMELNENNPTYVMEQSKTFIQLFEEMNEDKDLKSIELNLNTNSNKNQFKFNNNFENILEVIEIMPL